MISKLLKKMGISGIEIKPKEENPETMEDIHNILSKNSFNSNYNILSHINKYYSDNKDNKRGRVLFTKYPGKNPFLSFFFVDKDDIKQIEEELEKKGYSFDLLK